MLVAVGNWDFNLLREITAQPCSVSDTDLNLVWFYLLKLSPGGDNFDSIAGTFIAIHWKVTDSMYSGCN